MLYAIAKKASSVLGLLAVFGLALSSISNAQDFEGVIQQRSITLEGDALMGFVYALEEENEDKYEELGEDDEKYMRWMTEQILAIPMDELLAGSGGAAPTDGTLYVKGQKIRTEVQEEGVPFDYFIIDTEAGTMIMVSEAQKFYVKWSSEEMRAMMGGMGGGPGGMGNPGESHSEIRPLGTSETINGMSCETYAVEGDDELSVGCISSEHPALRRAFHAFNERMGGMFGEEDESGAADLFWEKGLPVRTQTLHGDLYSGYAIYEIEDVLSVERKSLSSDLFAIPAGYTEKSMQELWGQG